jgi:hypothetical protein
VIIIFSPATRLTVLGSLLREQSFIQHSFISEIVPVSTKDKLRFQRYYPYVTFSVHTDSPPCQNGRMATAECERRKFERVEPPPCSPDLSPCDFWFFGFLKESLKDQQLLGVRSLHRSIADLGAELAFEDVWVIFIESMNCLS